MERVTTSPRRARSFAMKSLNAAGESLLAGTAPVFRILSCTSAFASALPNSSASRMHSSIAANAGDPGPVLFFTEEEGRVRFAASLPAAAARGLRLSSKLLAVAQKVEGR